jgi:hypothetical protein
MILIKDIKIGDWLTAKQNGYLCGDKMFLKKGKRYEIQYINEMTHLVYFKTDLSPMHSFGIEYVREFFYEPVNFLPEELFEI